jgi:hypothetical protein
VHGIHGQQMGRSAAAAQTQSKPAPPQAPIALAPLFPPFLLTPGGWHIFFVVWVRSVANGPAYDTPRCVMVGVVVFFRWHVPPRPLPAPAARSLLDPPSATTSVMDFKKSKKQH